MNKDEFTKYLRGQYCSPPEIAQDNLGGFIVPEIAVTDKKGLSARIYRRIGRLLRSKYLYKKGTTEFNLREAIIDFIKASDEKERLWKQHNQKSET